jgi:hypothetical protein
MAQVLNKLTEKKIRGAAALKRCLLGDGGGLALQLTPQKDGASPRAGCSDSVTAARRDGYWQLSEQGPSQRSVRTPKSCAKQSPVVATPATLTHPLVRSSPLPSAPDFWPLNPPGVQAQWAAKTLLAQLKSLPMLENVCHRHRQSTKNTAPATRMQSATINNSTVMAADRKARPRRLATTRSRSRGGEPLVRERLDTNAAVRLRRV